MTELEEATLYYTIIETTNNLPVDNRLKYIELVNKITGSSVARRTCNNSLKKAHSYFSTYLYKNQEL